MNRRSKIQLIKYILYSFLMIVLYVLQTDPNFTLSSGTGLFAGILCDTSSSVLFGSGIAGALLHATLADQQFNFYRQRVCGSAAIGILFLLCYVGI